MPFLYCVVILQCGQVRIPDPVRVSGVSSAGGHRIASIGVSPPKPGMLLRLYREPLRVPRSSGHLLEAEEDVIARAAKDGQRSQSFFQAAEYAKEAWMLASPGFKIGRRHSNSDSRAGVEPKIRRKGSANLAEVSDSRP